MRVKRKRRIAFVSLLLIGGAVAASLVLFALGQNLLYFYSPSQVAAGELASQQTFRLGGMVERGSVRREADGLTVRFTLTDFAHALPVTYRGLLPDLFREGQGIVAHGRVAADGSFRAEKLEAKHDENYMPPEVASALKKTGKDASGGSRPQL
jgi:cytochrome c-type biogenesis protein CcmE